MNQEKGQLLIELLVAMAVFVLGVSVTLFLILDSFVASRVGREKMTASLLSKEGLEAVISIRNNDWDDLTVGEHGLAISGGNWVLQGSEDDISGELREGIRKIIVENIDSDRKKVISKVTWRVTEGRAQDVTLITYLTNWQKPAPPFVVQSHYRWRNDDGGQ